LPAETNARSETLATTVTEVSELVGALVREEIELARAEVTTKANTIARGAAAVAIGAAFGVFALIFALFTLANGLNSALDSVWLGYLITFVILTVLTIVAFLFAWRKLRVGPPTPTMAIDEARKIRDTVAETSEIGT
jgi:hypothetical protein